MNLIPAKNEFCVVGRRGQTRNAYTIVRLVKTTRGWDQFVVTDNADDAELNVSYTSRETKKELMRWLMIDYPDGFNITDTIEGAKERRDLLRERPA